MYSLEYLSDLKRDQDTEEYTKKMYGDYEKTTNFMVPFFDERNEENENQ